MFSLPGQRNIAIPFGALLLSLALSVSILEAANAKGPQARPNIVLCVLDDMDYGMFGFREHPDALTPTLDRLARKGTVVETCYMQSRCAPSLASILTGRLAHEHGRYFNIDETGLNRTLDSGSMFVGKLRDLGGYQTYAGGKWWEGFGTIEEAGFDAGEISGNNNSVFVRVDEQSHLFDWMDTLESENPFFIWWAPLLPHLPHDPPQRFLDLFDKNSLIVPDCIAPRDREIYRFDQQYYLATIAWVDHEIGRLLEKIREIGRRDNTLFVTVIDNGWSYECEASKGFHNRAAWESPMILTYPDRVPMRETRDHLARAADIFPTLLDYAGITHGPVSGESLLPIVKNPEAPWRSFLVDLTYPARSRADAPFLEAYSVLVRAKAWSYARALKPITSFQNPDNRIKHFYTNFPTRGLGEEDFYRLLLDPDERNSLTNTSDVGLQNVLLTMRQVASDWLTDAGYPLLRPSR